MDEIVKNDAKADLYGTPVLCSCCTIGRNAPRRGPPSILGFGWLSGTQYPLLPCFVVLVRRVLRPVSFLSSSAGSLPFDASSRETLSHDRSPELYNAALDLWSWNTVCRRRVKLRFLRSPRLVQK